MHACRDSPRDIFVVSVQPEDSPLFFWVCFHSVAPVRCPVAVLPARARVCVSRLTGG